MARIDDLIYVDDLTKNSDKLSSVTTVSVISHKKVTIPLGNVPVSGTPYKATFNTPSFSPAPLISPARGERTPFLVNNNKANRRGFGVKRVLTNYLGVDTKAKICGNLTEISSVATNGYEGLEHQKNSSSANQNGTKLRQNQPRYTVS